jgi:hypothetical protein
MSGLRREIGATDLHQRRCAVPAVALGPAIASATDSATSGRIRQGVAHDDHQAAVTGL